MLLAALCLAQSALAEAEQSRKSLLPPDAVTRLSLAGQAQLGRLSVEPATGAPASQVARLETTARTQNDWDVSATVSIPEPLAKGDVLLLTFYARAAKGQPETGEARFAVDVQTNGPSYAKSVTRYFGVGSTWQRCETPLVVAHATPAGGSNVSFRLGFGAQIVEIAGLELWRYPEGTKVQDLPWSATRYAGDEPNAAWRAEAEKRIEALRKGEAAIRVTGADGKPIAGAKVEFQMKRHAFGFGSAVDAGTLFLEGSDGDRYRKTVIENYGLATIENHLKWPFWEDWGRKDGLRALDWLREKGLLVRGHTLIWPGWKEMPKDMPSLESDPVALRKRVQTHFEDILGVTRGKIVEWDVMNEPYAQNDMMRILGWTEMGEWFRMAKRLEPNARLAVNDYPLPDSLGGGSAHLNHYAGVVERLLAEKAPVEAIGFQGHFGDNVVPPERLLGGLDRFAKYGLPIVITEFDINTKDEDLQARYMRDFLTACFSHPSVDTLVIWGFWEGRHWFPDAGLYRRDWSLRPQGQVWLDLVKKRWWTNAVQASDSRGESRVSGFFGDYEVVVSAPGYKPERVEVGHTKSSPLSRTVVLERS